MTKLNDTVKAYENGSKELAYELFLTDETGNDVNFNEFCEGMENIIRSRAEMANAEKAHSQVVYN